MDGNRSDVFDLVQEGIIIRDLDGRITGWNGAATTIYGWTSRQAIGRSVHELLRTSGIDPKAAEASVYQTNSWSGDIERRTAGGRKIIVTSSWHAQFNADGTPGGILETAVDVTLQRDTEAALRRTEHRYSNLFQAMAVSFWELDFTPVGSMVGRLLRDGVSDLSTYFDDHTEFVDAMIHATHVIDVNESSVKLFGRGEKNEMLNSIDPYWPRESRTVYAEAVVAAVQGKPYFATETRLTTLDGRELDVWFTACFPPEMMTRGKLLIGIIDISATKKARSDLERSNERYHNLFHFMPISLTQLDATKLFAIFQKLKADGVRDLSNYIDDHPEFITQATDAIEVIETNHRALELTEADSVEQVLGPISYFWTESPEVMRRALEARYRGENRFASELKFRTFKNNIRHAYLVSEYATPLGPLGVGISAIVDITERVKAQTMLERLRAEFAHGARVSALGELVASIAHEINQPLGAIRNSGEASLRWLSRADPDLNELRWLSNQTVSDARRASEIIQRLRALAIRKEPEKSSLVLNTIVREAFLFLAAELRNAGVTTALELADALPDISGDRILIQQVIANLAINAVQAMDGRSTKRLTVTSGKADGEFLFVAVEDTGTGIDEANMEALFQSFFTTKRGGMGIGLPICRSIVEAHGGHIEASNRRSGAGARFRFTLPVALKSRA
ncbi:ATP-binding protein [Bradyrhizobium sp. Tv2a-2]|uniref:ATP-binding protein n=1 Tax=Bradyrhizobium sp. Tv2a-2 TaxID=113395 RepID=UPI00042275E8|nr:ATP-binding protein [Bradyrhizobium sp. Tv2a-2]